HVFFRFVHAGNIGEGNLYLVFAEHLGLALAEGHRTALAAHTATLHLAHEEHEHGNDDQDGERGDQQLFPDALLFGFGANDTDVVRVQVVHQLRILDQRANGAEYGAVRALADDVDVVDRDLADLAGLHFTDQVGIDQLLGLGRLAEILEKEQHDRGDGHPQNQVLHHVVQVTASLAIAAVSNWNSGTFLHEKRFFASAKHSDRPWNY